VEFTVDFQGTVMAFDEGLHESKPQAGTLDVAGERRRDLAERFQRHGNLLW
jgi:histidine ammonia-lyase